MFHTIKLNNKLISYTDHTTFLVQVGKGAKGSYKTKYSFKGDIRKAAFYYDCTNIGNGYKKRLLMCGANKPVLVRAFS